MSRQASTSPSEGETTESRPDKATSAMPFSSGTGVNRRLREALSPSRSPSPPSLGKSSWRNDRSRSRSPYRHPRPYGEKRRRNDIPYQTGGHKPNDSRRFQTRHEPRSAQDCRYDGKKHTDERRYLNYEDHDHHANKRQRTRSRSPEPPSTSRYHKLNAEPVKSSRSRQKDKDRHQLQHRPAQGGNEARDVGRNAEPSVKREGPLRDNSDIKQHAKAPFKSEQPNVRSLGSVDGLSNSATSKLNDSASASNIDDGPLSEPTVTEASYIEERRKRREAIKAKYRGGASPMSVSHMNQSAESGSTPATPNAAEQAPQKSAFPPHIPSPDVRHDSGRGSLEAVPLEKDPRGAHETAEHYPSGSYGSPSAADYDPTQDTREDREREQQRHHVQDVSAESYDETKADDRIKPLSQSDEAGKSPAKKKTYDDDMFASDVDDDDMFAPVAPKKLSGPDAESPKDVSKKQAKRLDRDLIDDWDDHEKYYRVILGELLDSRYHVKANLGKGIFSSVIRAVDNQTERLVAIKIIRNNDHMMKEGMKEMQILQRLADADPDDRKHMIRLQRSFSHKGHLCMVFENLHINLREVIKKFGRDVGINLKAVRSYAQQMFLGLSLLRKCNVLHADLKPDNVLVNEAGSALKICDLGSATDASTPEEATPYLVSRFYRAPEIVLGVPYDFAIDMWSIGCTLFELYTGKILFTGRTNNQMLRSIMECRGKFSLKMLKKAELGAVHFDEQTLHFRSIEHDRITNRDVLKTMNIVNPMPGRDLKSRLMAAGQKDMGELEKKELNLFADLLDRCLALNPERRITPGEALKHPFINRGTPAFSGARA